MESIITQQKIARRRPFVGIQGGPTGSRRAAGSRGGRGKEPKADFFLLEGGGQPPRSPAIAFKSRPGRAFPPTRPRFAKLLPERASPFARRKRGSGLLSRWISIISTLGSSLASALRALPARGSALLRGPSSSQQGSRKYRTANSEPEPRLEAKNPSTPLVRALLPASLGALLLAGLLLGYGILYTPAFPLPPSGILPAGSAEDALLAYLTPEMAEPAEETEVPLPPRSLEIERYTVRAGDSLGRIAAKAGLSMDSLVSMNGIKSARGLREGTELKIPNMDGLVHVVAKGESLGSIAAKYKTELSLLADANDLGTALIRPGQSLFIPGAKLPPSEIKRVLGELTLWPLRGRLSSYYGYRADPFTAVRRFHAGIDIVAPSGSPITAAMEGRVADLGYNAIFGNYVILNHAEGMQTLYGHMSSISVKRGQSISQSQRLGAVGSTGYSTGPHLHFGLFKNGSPVNPLKYLK